MLSTDKSHYFQAYKTQGTFINGKVVPNKELLDLYRSPTEVISRRVRWFGNVDWMQDNICY
jgi:hypothetical protein